MGDVPGYNCEGSKTMIWCPDDESSKRPVVLFAHGQGGWKTEEHKQITEAFASMGSIVIAPATAGGNCQSSADLITALDYSKDHPELHSCLQNADWDNVGLSGHSMGAKHLASVVIDNAESRHIKAAVFMHGASETAELRTPSMFMTAADDKTATSSVVDEYNGATNLHHKVLTDQKTGGHYEPEAQGTHKLNDYAGKFLSCFLRRVGTHCQAIYGPPTDGIVPVCEASNVDYQECHVEGNSPVARRLRGINV